MTKNNGIVSTIFSRLLFIGFSAQILFGLIWMGLQFGYLQLFEDTAFYVKVSGSLQCDEYTGVLYPTILLIIRALCMVLPIRWYSVMYFLQVEFAIFSGYYLLKSINFKSKNALMCIWGSLVLATFPFMMQCHMAILPNSLSLSLMMLEVAFAVKAWGSAHIINGKGFAFDIGRVCLFVMLSSLSEMRYIAPGVVLVVVLLVRSVVKMRKAKKGGIKYPILVIIAFAAITVGLFTLTQTKGLYDKPAKTIEAALFERVFWKSRLMRRSSWTEELVNLADYDTINNAMYYQGDVMRKLMPEIESRNGIDMAKQYYVDIVRLVFREDAKELMHDVVIDGAASFMSPVLVKMFLDGRSYISYTAGNYDVMTRNAPIITKYYFDYSMFWFEIALMISAVSGMLVVISKKREVKVKASFALTTMIGIILSIQGALGASGTYDYKQTLFTTSVWLVCMMMVV